METMACRHCGTSVEYVPQDHGRQFVCVACGKPGIYGFGADEAKPESAASPFGQPNGLGQNVPPPAKPKSAGGVLAMVGGGAIGVAAIFGLVGKGAKHAGKAMNAVPTRSIPAQLPSKFTASPYRATPASSGFAPSAASNASGGMTYFPVGAGFHASRALSRESGEDDEQEEGHRIATESEAAAEAGSAAGAPSDPTDSSIDQP